MAGMVIRTRIHVSVRVSCLSMDSVVQAVFGSCQQHVQERQLSVLLKLHVNCMLGC